MSFFTTRDVRESWPLWARWLCVSGVYGTLLLAAVTAAFGTDRMGHILAGGLGLIAVRGLWDTLQDVILWWPARHERGFIADAGFGKQAIGLHASQGGFSVTPEDQVRRGGI